MKLIIKIIIEFTIIDINVSRYFLVIQKLYL